MTERTTEQSAGEVERNVVHLLSAQGRGLTSLQIQRQLADDTPRVMIDNALANLEGTATVERVRGHYWQMRDRPRATPQLTIPATVPAAKTPVAEVPVRDHYARSRWAAFRRLCGYYAECLRIEASQKIDTYGNREDERFITIPEAVDLTGLDQKGRIAIQVQRRWAKFITYAKKCGPEASLFLGAPVWVHVGTDRETRENYRRVFPVFVMPVEMEMQAGAMHLISLDRWEVNHGWLEGRFKKSDDRRAFLDLMGLASPTPVGSLVSLMSELLRYHENWWREASGTNPPTGRPALADVVESGIYRRLVLIVQPKLKYTWRLVQELRRLSDEVDDESLDQSALRHLFPHHSKISPPNGAPGPNLVGAKPETSPLPDLPAAIETLNPEQWTAAVHAIRSPVSVVGGPPGTGKSRLVGQVMADAALRGQPTLFASRNHQAIAAVVPRLNAIADPNPLVINLARRFSESGETSGISLLQAIRDVLNQPNAPDVSEQLEKARSQIALRLRATEDCRRELDRAAEVRQHIESAIESLGNAARPMNAEASERLWFAASPEGGVITSATPELLRQHEARLIEQVGPTSCPTSWWMKPVRTIRDWWFARYVWPRIHADVLSCATSFNAPALPKRASPAEALACVRKWLPYAEGIAAARQVQRYRSELSAMPAWGELLARLPMLGEDVVRASRRGIILLARNLGAQATGSDRQALQEIKAEIEGAAFPLTGREEKRLTKLLRERLATVLKHLPLWSTVNLSAGRDIPLAPALFDLLIIDEASQCDIASVIPLLYRSRRVMVVGDPMQLSHVAPIPKDTHQYIRTRFELDGVEYSRFMHPQNSFYDLASSDSRTVATVQLKDHHRSHPDIAEYSNRVFYREQLNVLTDRDRLQALPDSSAAAKQQRMGIMWTDIPGDPEPAQGGGAISRGQIDAIVKELLRLRDIGFQGSVGVVTPFKAQANRLRDAAMEAMGSSVSARWNFHVDTADGFQGGERDVMLFSLVGGELLPRGSLHFLAEQPNRFNVAASRARAVLHVFGDRRWARACGVKHIVKLEAAVDRQDRQASILPPDRRAEMVGPVWEPRFGQALRAAGLPVQSQYPILGRFYADFALLRSGCKIAIEVDGETWHRDADGNRKMDDVRRDLAFSAAQWQVIRFWVYELREDMLGCVAQVKAAWERK